MKLRIVCIGLAVGGLMAGVMVAHAGDLGSSPGYWSETRNFALSNTPIVDLNVVDKSLSLGFSTSFALLSLDVSHDAAGKLHGYAQMQFIEVVQTTNQVVFTVTNPVVRTITNQVVEAVTNEVVSTITNEVVSLETNEVVNLVTNEVAITVTNEVVTAFTNQVPPQFLLEPEVTGTNELIETNLTEVVSTNEVSITQTNELVHFVTNAIPPDTETNYLVLDVSLVKVETNQVDGGTEYVLTFNDGTGSLTNTIEPLYSEEIAIIGTNVVCETNQVEVVSTNEVPVTVTNQFVGFITNTVCTTNGDSTIETNYEYLVLPPELVNLATNELILTNIDGNETNYEYVAVVTNDIFGTVTNLVFVNETNLVSFAVTNLIPAEVTNLAVGAITNLVTEDVTNLVSILVTNKVPGLNTNITASLFGPIAGSVSGPVGKQKVSLSARATGYAVQASGTGQTSASATLSLSGKLDQGLLVLGANCKLVAKSQANQTKTITGTTFTIPDLEWEPAYLSDTLMITSSLLPTKVSGTDARGNMRCAGQAVLTTAAEHSLYGSTVQTWDQARNSLQEVANFNGTGTERGAFVRWKANRGLDQPRGGAMVTGKLLGQNFSQAVFFDWP